MVVQAPAEQIDVVGQLNRSLLQRLRPGNQEAANTIAPFGRGLVTSLAARQSKVGKRDDEQIEGSMV